MTTPQLQYPEDLLYTNEHIWVRMLDGVVMLGISDFAQDQLGEVAFVDLPAVGRHFETGREFGTVESVKSANSLYCPYAGEVVTVNSGLEDAPALINTDPYGKGWLITLRCDVPVKSVTLLSATDYRAFLKRL